ncbi:MAG TPA: hypothetical protein VFQ59_00220 [Candidatus Paceibacterota bacterium]|nr:hypothetical protein [Candidatus Paceibacterota bacterium]
MDKYYGLYLCGEDFNRKLSNTYLPVGQVSLPELVEDIPSHFKSVGFKVEFGFIKELTCDGERIVIQSPSKVGGDKLQAFLVKKKSDVVTFDETYYYINGKRLDHRFNLYKVTIIEEE